MSTEKQQQEVLEGNTVIKVDRKEKDYRTIITETFNDSSYEVKQESILGEGEGQSEYSKVDEVNQGYVNHKEELKDKFNRLEKNVIINPDRAFYTINQYTTFDENAVMGGSLESGVMGSTMTFLRLNSFEEGVSKGIDMQASARMESYLKVDDKNVVRSINGILANDTGELPLEINVLTSADGSKFKLMVSNEGFLGVQKIQ